MLGDPLGRAVHEQGKRVEQVVVGDFALLDVVPVQVVEAGKGRGGARGAGEVVVDFRDQDRRVGVAFADGVDGAGGQLGGGDEEVGDLEGDWGEQGKRDGAGEV